MLIILKKGAIQMQSLHCNQHPKALQTRLQTNWNFFKKFNYGNELFSLLLNIIVTCIIQVV